MEQAIDEVATITQSLAKGLADEKKRYDERAVTSKARYLEKQSERDTARKELPQLEKSLESKQREIERLTEESRILSERIAGSQMLVNSEGSMYDIVKRALDDWKSDQFKADSFIQDKIKTMVQQ